MAPRRRNKNVAVTMVRKLASSAQAVYEAWTEPRQLAKWLTPAGDTITSVTLDLRIGGRYRFEGINSEGKPYSLSGTFLDLVRGTRVAMSWAYDGPVSSLKGGASVVTADLVELAPDLTELTLTHEQLSGRDAAEFYRVAWTECVGKLENVSSGKDTVNTALPRTENTEFYTDSQRDVQDSAETRRLADRLEAVLVHDHLSVADAAFIAHQNMFFIATTDAYGQPNCSYKGGARGFVAIIDEYTLAFPDYNGNGMHLSVGNIGDTSKVGLLFIDFERQARMRVLGKATVSENDRLMRRYPGAERIVRVKVEAVFSNCPRYVHKLQLIEESTYIPTAESEPPAPQWKRLNAVADVLPEKDKKHAGNATDLNKTLNKD